jgi:hypothetical protein
MSSATRQATYRKRHPERTARCSARARYKRTYGITYEERDRLFVAQGRCCASCKVTEPRGKKGWCTDHDHKTGKVRGIVCNHCNLIAGLANDDVGHLAQVIEYLRNRSCQ